MDVAIDGDTFFLLNSTGITRTQSAGGQSDSLVEVTATNLGRLLADGSRVYFTEGRMGGQVGSVPKDGDGGLVALATGQHRPSFLVRGNGGIIFVNQAIATAGAVDGAIFFAPTVLPGSALEKIPGLPRVGSLVTDGVVAYYSLPERGEIWAFELTTFQPALVMSGITTPEHLAIDATHVYFSGRLTPAAANGIYRFPRCGGKILKVTTTTGGQPTGLVLRDSYVYWASTGAFFRTSK